MDKILRLMVAGLIVLGAIAIPGLAAERPFEVEILSATTKGQGVPGVRVEFQREGQSPVSATTEARGRAVVPNPFGTDDRSVSMIVRKEGFAPLVVRCPCSGLSYAISENLGAMKIDAFRLVLSWGGSPADLDMHAVYPQNHVYYQKRAGKDAYLDVDDTNGFGPETVTIGKRHSGESYVFAVHNYSAGGRVGTKSLSQSGAKAFVYVGESLVKAYYISPGRRGALWVLFAVDGDGAFHDIDEVLDVADQASVQPYLRQYGRRASLGVPAWVSARRSVKAMEVCRAGDGAFRRGEVERAIELYLKAIDQDPNYAQAYSGLARAYQKVGRVAEATWAERKNRLLGRWEPTGPRLQAGGEPTQVLGIEATHLAVITTSNWAAPRGMLQRFQLSPRGGFAPVGRPVPAIVGRNGLAWGKGLHPQQRSGPQKREGDGRAPAGVFQLGTAYGYADLLPGDLGVSYHRITSSTDCVEDSRSGLYGMVVDRADFGGAVPWSKSLRLMHRDGLYRWAVKIEHNPDRSPGMGSCSFLHVWKGTGQTAMGDASVAPEVAEAIVRWIRGGTSLLVQLPASEYRALAAAWNLPPM